MKKLKSKRLSDTNLNKRQRRGTRSRKQTISLLCGQCPRGGGVNSRPRAAAVTKELGHGDAAVGVLRELRDGVPSLVPTRVQRRDGRRGDELERVVGFVRCRGRRGADAVVSRHRRGERVATPGEPGARDAPLEARRRWARGAKKALAEKRKELGAVPSAPSLTRRSAPAVDPNLNPSQSRGERFPRDRLTPSRATSRPLRPLPTRTNL